MGEENIGIERRKHERILVEFPLNCKIGRKTLIGNTVNACKEGMMVESSLALKTALQMFGTLTKKRKHCLNVEFTFKEKTYRTEAEIKHFHLDFLGSEPYRFTVGFWIPKLT